MSALAPPSPYSYWVITGRFAAGEYPGAKDPAEAAPKVESLLKSGINHFIDLTGLNMRGQPDNLTPYSEIAQEQAHRLGLSVGWEQHTIVDGNIPTSPWHMARILDAIDAALERRQYHLPPLPGRSGAYRHSGRVLACAARIHRGRGPPPHIRVVERNRIGRETPPRLAGDTRTARVCARLDRAVG